MRRSLLAHRTHRHRRMLLGLVSVESVLVSAGSVCPSVSVGSVCPSVSAGLVCPSAESPSVGSVCTSEMVHRLGTVWQSEDTA